MEVLKARTIRAPKKRVQQKIQNPSGGRMTDRRHRILAPKWRHGGKPRANRLERICALTLLLLPGNKERTLHGLFGKFDKAERMVQVQTMGQQV